ncbi:MAG: SDR family NAD(P)-dependent oxidoreductase [Actinomycetota bacterium]|nr:SDR family NAD(P)-dependent oxidoreductase [Actinomycetota bacterium]
MNAVVVTGASSGIGRATAMMLVQRGFDVYAGARKPADAEALKAAGGARMHPIHLDVTDEASIAAAAQEVSDAVGETGLAGLVNNAGTTAPGPVEYLSLETFRRQLEVNLVGPLAVTQAMLPMLRSGRGRVVNVSSGAGKAAIPLMAPYVTAKHGLEGLSDVMRLEFGRLGVGVSVIEPGFIATPMGGRLERDTAEVLESMPPERREAYAGQLVKLAEQISGEAEHGSPPEVVAEAILHALTSRRPRTRYAAGAGSARLLFLRRVLPDRWFDRIILRTTGLDRV